MYHHSTSSLFHHLKRKHPFSSTTTTFLMVQKLLLNNKKNDCKAEWLPWHHFHSFRSRVNKGYQCLKVGSAIRRFSYCGDRWFYKYISASIILPLLTHLRKAIWWHYIISSIWKRPWVCCDVEFTEAFLAVLTSRIGNTYDKCLPWTSYQRLE